MRRLEDKVLVKKNYCPKCINDAVNISWKLEVLDVDDKQPEPVEYWLPNIECPDCGTSSAFEAVSAMHDAACFAQRLVTPEQIKSTRKKYNMNTKAFADLTGISETTIKRWESRAYFPNKSDSTLIQLVQLHGPDLIYDLRADNIVQSEDVPAAVNSWTESIFSEVESQSPEKLSNASRETKDMLALLG